MQLDWLVGQMLGEIDRLGIRANTIVLFTVGGGDCAETPVIGRDIERRDVIGTITTMFGFCSCACAAAPAAWPNSADHAPIRATGDREPSSCHRSRPPTYVIVMSSCRSLADATDGSSPAWRRLPPPQCSGASAPRRPPSP
jgi:hypothetical protein